MNKLMCGIPQNLIAYIFKNLLIFILYFYKLILDHHQKKKKNKEINSQFLISVSNFDLKRIKKISA